MAEHLVFQLAASMAAMGDLAGHERRGSLAWPGRSALIGLMGAALGIRRDGDFTALEALTISVAVFSSGEVLRDYHTVETVPSAAARRPQSRPEALRVARGRTNTTVTLRDYRVGVLYGVAVTGLGLPPVAEALRRPTFAPYLGRRSCPLAAPLDPRIVDAPDAAAALAQLRLPPWWQGARARVLVTDAAAAAPGARVELRHDRATDRRAWHFAAREVALVPVDIAPATAGAAA